ncbi:MAG: PAS domain-containing sensor histidine kinase [Bacillota bacterium]
MKISPEHSFLFANIKQIAYYLIDIEHFGPVNKKMLDICNLSREEIEYQHISAVFNSREIDNLKNFYKKLFKHGREKKSCWSFVNESNEKRFLEVNSIPHKNEKGEVDYVLCLAEDITDELRKEEKLFRSRERYRGVFDHAPLALMVTDIENNILDWNKTAEKIFGWKKEEVLNKDFTIIIPDDLQEEITEFTQKLFQGGRTHNINKNVCRDGKEIICEWDTAVIRDENNEILEFISIAQDITKKLEAEKKIEAQKEELKYNEIRTRFFANVSHELKTPLNLIFSTLQVINFYRKQDSQLEEDKKLDKYLNLIKQNGYRLLRVVNNLIDITRIGAESFKINRGNYDIVFVVKSIVESVSDFISDRDRKLTFKTDIDSKVIACDPFNIERIMLNLLSNAVKFTEMGDEITVSIKKKKDKIIISVRDTGIGIKKDEQQIIFEQFRQIDKGFNRQKEGSGIGLSLVKSIVEMHGGKISVDSEFGKYSQFSFSLPLVKVSREEDDSEKYKADNLLNKVDLEFSDIYDVKP